jgi:hypothetical protein
MVPDHVFGARGDECFGVAALPQEQELTNHRVVGVHGPDLRAQDLRGTSDAAPARS